MSSENGIAKSTKPGPPRGIIAHHKRTDRLFALLGLLAMTLALALLVTLLGQLALDGVGRLSWQFLSSYPSRFQDQAGILSAWIGTVLVMFLTALTAVRDRIAGAIDGRPLPAFSIVLIGPMLWTRYVPAAGTLQVEAHSAGPASGDVVVVTDEPVLGAWIDGRVTPREARESGLVRFYGAPADIAPVMALLDLLTPARSASAAGFERGPVLGTP